MGLYINPIGETKESWLEREAVEVAGAEAAATWREGGEILPVCLVDNGAFTAAAVIYSDGEMKTFIDRGDSRKKRWFVVEVEKIRKVCGQEADLYLELAN